MTTRANCPPEPESRTTRRTFLGRTALAAATVSIVPRHVLGGDGKPAPSEKLNIAGIGVGGQGAGDLRDMESENIGALCDVDWRYAAHTFKAYPKAEVFKDYRVLLEKRKDIDAVMIATPDHMHAPIALAALRAGKHVYVEKPMAHSIEEARVMTRVAKETGLVTQMGNNGHAGEGLRLIREWIQGGVIGAVREIHCWSDRPGTFWRQDLDRPAQTPPIPPDLDWNLWIGAAPMRPYHPVYIPQAWRGWFDFGTGALGDMAIHNMDPAFYALDLGAPAATEARTSPLKKESYPAWTIITYEFAAKGDRPAVNIVWYDGGKMPPRPAGLEPDRKLADNGIYFVGDRGTMLCGGWSGPPRLVPESRMKDLVRPPKTIARSIGHRAEWIQACKQKKPADAKAGFDYSGPFTEALLVGNLAVRLQKRIEWDSAAMKATNVPEADPLIRKAYRSGFGI
jgi:predicted dehydrogenase